MKKEKKNPEMKATYILDLIASICFFISSILEFIDGNRMAVMNLCLGSVFLGLAVVYYKKYSEANKEDKETKKQHTTYK